MLLSRAPGVGRFLASLLGGLVSWGLASWGLASCNLVAVASELSYYVVSSLDGYVVDTAPAKGGAKCCFCHQIVPEPSWRDEGDLSLGGKGEWSWSVACTSKGSVREGEYQTTMSYSVAV